jgi:hypothetical protein
LECDVRLEHPQKERLVAKLATLLQVDVELREEENGAFVDVLIKHQ